MATAAEEETDREMTSCDECGEGDFFYVEDRDYPGLCLDCSDERKRKEGGWTPEISSS